MAKKRKWTTSIEAKFWPRDRQSTTACSITRPVGERARWIPCRWPPRERLLNREEREEQKHGEEA